ncbi:MAG: ketoacyl-ACP synthase III [Clostridia bacterium]|nr:ketoacyl-ACP synthase III [Clostridia bacterium]NCC43910.1 ketoacyl-ACP synthase III [Clostridia bacterium]
MTTRIVGTGSSLPANNISNDQLSSIVETSDEWISSRTGIRNRRIVKEETGASMAVNAAKAALENSGVAPEEIDLIIVATCSSDWQFPSTACIVQKEIGAVHAVAFDISAACSGFLFALNTAHAYFKAGIYKKALVIGTEVLSKLVDWEDRSTCVLFGDGAGAAVVEEAESGLEAFVQHSDGVKGSVLTCGGKAVHNPLQDTENGQEDKKTDYIAMDGQEVFKFAVKKVPECIHEVLEATHTKTEDIQWYILHQANSRIIQSVAKRLRVPEERFPMNMDAYGNTSAASIPILLDEMNRKGMLKKGDKVIMSGFGAGLTWSAAQLTW